ncbi:MAG: hypothetical protein Kow0042_02110 [Calditrichia bacterium]
MKLTPLDVRKQEFRKTLRGFDPIEVQTFLEMVAEEYEQVLEDNKQLQRRVVELETRLSDYQETEKNLRETLLNVQEVKKQSEESSRRQAELILKEAELKALEIIEMARKQARQMRDEVNILRSQKESFINRLRQILISQIELLSVLEIDDAVPEEAHEFMDKVRIRKKKSLGSRPEEVEQKTDDEEQKEQSGSGIQLDEEIETEEEQPSLSKKEQDFTVSADLAENQAKMDEVTPPEDKDSKKEKKEKKISEEDEINEFFKKGIQIDELIKNLDKKQHK